MVYELVWKNQRLNCFTQARSGTYTPGREKRKNDKWQSCCHHTELLHPCCFSCSLEKKRGCGSHLSGGFRLSFSDHFTCGHRYYIHQYVHTHSVCIRTQCTNSKQPKQTLDYTSHYGSRESHLSIWHEAWLSWKWGMLSHTLSLDWHHLHWCELMCCCRFTMTWEHSI